MQPAKSKLSGIFLKLAIIFFLISGYLVWQRYYAIPDLSFSSAPPSVSDSKFSPLPETLSILSLDISLPVVPTRIISGKWPTTSSGVSYILDSARPGQTGNSIFYGHNWPRLLGGLSRLKPGDDITVTDSHGTVFVYKVKRIIVVSPDDVSILVSGNTAKLTLYTCTGIADSKRLVVEAVLSPGY